MSLFIILLAGPLAVTPRLLGQIHGARVVAADGGMRHAAALGVSTELWIGDFDSSNDDDQRMFQNVPRVNFPREKDITDGQLAIDEAVKRGATKLILVGALGGQSDHVTAHLGLALRLARSGLFVLLTSGVEEAYPLQPGLLEIDAKPEWRFSIVPWSDVQGLTLSGTKWPLQGSDLSLGSTLTLSNEAEHVIRIQIKSGEAIAFLYPQGSTT